MSVETLEFKTELKQMMEIIIHSLYSNKEVFLRELISNAADAIDKVRFAALTEPALVEGDDQWQITIRPDESTGTLTISDNGIGMSRETIVEDLGTIARSGTREFMEKLKAAKDETRPELIGQFGVGFYAAFMVADMVTVTSCPAGNLGKGVKWQSDGTGTFTVEEVEKNTRGTEITLHLREDDKDWLQGWQIRNTVKRFSDFIEHPVVLISPKPVEPPKDGEEPKEEPATKELQEETLNSQQAIWLRAKSEVTEEEHTEFYKHISHDFDGPLSTIHYAAEGTMEFKALLYIPARRPFDMFHRDRKSGLHLHVKRVFIMDDCDKLLPEYLDFIRGVVDSADLPLNVSREMLQEDRQLGKIRKVLTGKVLSTLSDLQEKDTEKFATFWENFGTVVKGGLAQDFENREKIANLLQYPSINTEAGKEITLKQYVEAMPEGQDAIYYMIAESREMVENSPYVESFRAKGYDVLIMTDPVDEFVIPSLPNYQEKELKAIDRGALDDTKVEEEIVNQYKPLLEAVGTALEGVKEARLSTRLKESAACLVGEEGSMGAQMERLMKQMGNAMPPQEKILELNPEHPTVQALREAHAANADDPQVQDAVQLLYDEALLATGAKLKDPAALARRINALLAKTLGGK